MLGESWLQGKLRRTCEEGRKKRETKTMLETRGNGKENGELVGSLGGEMGCEGNRSAGTQPECLLGSQVLSSNTT